jgi:hypothetical protein
MRSLLFFVSMLTFGAAQATPIATLTFDVTMQGYVRTGNTVKMLNDPATARHTTATLQMPWIAVGPYRYDNAYATDVVLQLGLPQWSAGIQISSPVLLGLLDSAQTREIVDAALDSMGVTGTQPSTERPYMPRDYASVVKRDVHGVPAADRYYTMLDATIMRPSQDLLGIGEARLLNMIRVHGSDYDPAGNIDDFGLADVSEILKSFAASNRYGYNVQFTETVDTYNKGAFVDRPFEVTYGGPARLTGFTLDGVDMLHGDVPEPSALLLLGLGVAGLCAVSRMRAARSR